MLNDRGGDNGSLIKGKAAAQGFQNGFKIASLETCKQVCASIPECVGITRRGSDGECKIHGKGVTNQELRG